MVGIAKEFAKAFYKSKAWQRCREGYISSVFGLCERCEKPGLIVHHKIHLDASNINDVNITLNWENLMFLCLECHNQIHGSNNKIVKEGLMFDCNGELIKI